MEAAASPEPPERLRSLRNNKFQGKTLGILVGGGPAPGINGVIRSVTIQASNMGLRVIGIMDGFHWLSEGDASRVIPLNIEDVSRIHFQGGSLLRTSRTNPAKSPEMLANVVSTLRKLGVQYLITIGGDDTATSAMHIQDLVGGEIAIAHVPKTIDNDLPLPRYMSTFGFQTARHVGAAITKIILEDARTSERWFFLVSMGRKAGHLALGIGKASGATLTVIGEEFRNEPASLSTICDILEGAILKRLAMGRRDGVAVLAEGLIERVDPEEMARFTAVEHDAHGHIRLGEIELGRMLKNEVRRRLQERGLAITIVDKDIGYECRCADPIPFDLEYTQDLGYAAVTFLASGGSGAMVTVERGRIIPMPFPSLLDEKTGKARIREVDIDSDSYRVARHYMIRLDPADFEDPEHVAKLAAAGKLSPEEFESRFRYLTLDPPVRRALARS